MKFPAHCPQCGKEFPVDYNKTHGECLMDCITQCVTSPKFIELGLSIDQRLDIGKLFFAEINDFKISDRIAADRMKTTQYIAKTKKDNIKAMRL